MSVQHNHPFPGLRPFQQEEDHLFFGRDDQTMELLNTLSQHRFVAVVGTSGSGKSSLVRCGLLSQILGGKMIDAGAHWEVAVTHPGADPMRHLAEALLEAELYEDDDEDARPRLMATLNRSHLGLIEAIRQARLDQGTNFLLVVDQFEEIFRFHQSGHEAKDHAAEFVSMLLEATRQTEAPIYVVITMRSDFIGDCAQFEELAEAVNLGEYLIPRMTRDQFKQTIEGPVRVAGGRIASRLMQRLLNDLGNEADQLPCLQHALMRTWDQWKRLAAEGSERSEMDLEDYDEIGRMHEALSRHAGEIFHALPTDESRRLCEGMFKALTVRESEHRGIRRPQSLGQLAEILATDIQDLVPIVEAFRQPGVTFLMPPSSVPLASDTVIDISHESLMRVWVRLRDWVEEEAQSVGIYQRLRESARLHHQGMAGLYGNPELGIALSWFSEGHPNAAWAQQYGGHFEEVVAYLESSKKAAEQAEKEREAARQRELRQAKALAEAEQLRAEHQRRSAGRMRVLGGIASIIAVIALIATFVALELRKEARENESKAKLSEEEAELNASIAKESERAAIDAQEQLRESNYLADMLNHYVMYEGGELVNIQHNLAKYYPAPGEKDLRGIEWYLWYGAANREVKTLSRIWAFPAVPDTCDLKDWVVGYKTRSNAIQVFHKRSYNLIKEIPVPDIGRNIPELKGHALPCRAYLTRDGKFLFVVGRDFYIRRWNTEDWSRVLPDIKIPYDDPSLTGKNISTQSDANPGHYYFDSGDPPYLVFNNLGDRFVLRIGNAVFLYDAQTWEVERIFSTERPWQAIEFSPDDERLYYLMPQSPNNSETDSIFWRTGEQYENSEQSRIDLNSYSIHSSGDWMVVSNGDDQVHVLSLPDFKPMDSPSFENPGFDLKYVNFHYHGNRLVGAADGRRAFYWDVESGRLISTSTRRPGMEWGGVATEVRDEAWLANLNHGLRIWNLANMGHFEIIPDTENLSGWVSLVGGFAAASQNRPDLESKMDHEWIASLNQYFNPLPSPLRLFEVTDNGVEASFWLDGNILLKAHGASQNGRFLAGVDGQDFLNVWDFEAKTMVARTKLSASMNEKGFYGLKVTNNGRYAGWIKEVMTSGDRIQTKLYICDLENERVISTEALHESYVFEFSPDNQHLVLVSLSDSIAGRYLLSVDNLAMESGNRLVAWQFSKSIKFSPDGRLLASTNFDNKIHLNQPLRPGSEEARWPGHQNWVNAMDFTADGRQLITAGDDPWIKIWDTQTGSLRSILPKLEGGQPVHWLSIAKDQEWLAVKQSEKPLKIWRMPSAAEMERDAAFLAKRISYHVVSGNEHKAERMARNAKYVSEGGAVWERFSLATYLRDIEWMRELRAEMLASLPDPRPIGAQSLLAHLYMLRPSDAEVEQGIQLAEELYQGMPTNGYSDPHIVCVAIAGGKYHQGKYQEVLGLAEAFEAEKPQPAPFIRAGMESMRAMSLHQLGQIEEAEKALNKAREVFFTVIPKFDIRLDSIQDWIRDVPWAFYIQEAELLIEGKISTYLSQEPAFDSLPTAAPIQ